MFKVVKDRRAWWPVKFNGVTEVGARVIENEIEMRFFLHPEDVHMMIVGEGAKVGERARALVDEELTAKGENIAALTDDELGALMVGKLSHVMAEHLQKIACDWKGIGHENGTHFKWGDLEDMKLSVGVPNLFAAACEAYRKCRLGEKDVRAGN